MADSPRNFCAKGASLHPIHCTYQTLLSIQNHAAIQVVHKVTLPPPDVCHFLQVNTAVQGHPDAKYITSSCQVFDKPLEPAYKELSSLQSALQTGIATGGMLMRGAMLEMQCLTRPFMLGGVV